ncbi:MAG: proline-rich domain-containing protein [Candidatus Eremiobacterota bacterium]
MSKKPSKKSWTDKVKEKLFSPILSQGEEIEEVITDKESQVAEAYFRGKWENQQDGAKWAFFKSKNEVIPGKDLIEDDLDTVELKVKSGDLGKIPEEKETPSRIEGVVSITDLGRASTDSRYTRTISDKEGIKSEPVSKAPLKTTKKFESLATAPLGTKMEKKLAYKEMTSPLKSKTQTAPLPKTPLQKDKAAEESSLLSSIKEKSATLIEESRKWNYFRKSQDDTDFTSYKEKTRITGEEEREKKNSVPDILQAKPEPERQKVPDIDKIEPLPQKFEKPEQVSIDTPYTQPPMSPAMHPPEFTRKTGGEEDFTSLYPGLYGSEPPQSNQGFMDYQTQGYPQGYPSSYPQGYGQPAEAYPQGYGQPAEAYPQGYGPPAEAYPQGYGASYPQGYGPPAEAYPQGYGPPVYPQGYGPPAEAYPQGYGPPVYPQGYGPPAYPQGYGPPVYPQGYGPSYPQGYGPSYPQGYGPTAYPQGYGPTGGYPNVQVEVFMIQQILNYLLQSGIFTQLQSFLSKTDLPSSKNEIVIGEVVKKVLEEVKKQNPEGTMTRDQEHFIQNKLAGTIAALNIKKSDTNTLEIKSGDLKIKQPDMSGQISPELYAAPQTSYLGAKGTTPLDMPSLSQITSRLNLSQAPSTTPLTPLYSQETTPLSLSQAPSTTPLSLSQAPSTTPLGLPQAPSTAPLVMPKANITSQLDLFKYLYKEEEKPEKFIKEGEVEKKEKREKDIYSRILKTSTGEETKEVVEEVEDWFKKKGLKQEEYKKETELALKEEEKKTATPVTPNREEKKTAPLVMPVRESDILEDWESEITLSTDWGIDQSADDMGWMEIFDTVELKEEELIANNVSHEVKEEALDLLKTLAKCEKLLKSSPSKPKKVLTLCKKLLIVYPGNPLVYHMASEAYDKLGNREKADKYRKKADNIDG